MNELLSKLEFILKQGLIDLGNMSDYKEVEELRGKLLGRKGIITDSMKTLRDIPPKERPEVGKKVNSIKSTLTAAFEKKISELKSSISSKSIDVTLPGRRQGIGRKHPVTQVIDDAIDIFRQMGFVAAVGPDIEDEYHNFDALNTPADHPSRDIQDTFYLPDGSLLRTQTSPVQIRVMEMQKPPVRIVAPGRCYRRDTPDATHSVNFHQVEGLYVDVNVSLADLKATLLKFAHEMFGKDVNVRFRPHFFPFTEPSLEYDFSCMNCKGKGCRVCKNSGWLEISGAGMVDPEVFKHVGYDPEKYTGFAFGMGVERLAMIRYNVPDIRLFYENDVRFLQQF